jgi:hypothetical protein
VISSRRGEEESKASNAVPRIGRVDEPPLYEVEERKFNHDGIADHGGDRYGAVITLTT